MESLKKQAAKLLGEQKKYRRWLAVFLCLAVLVTAGTTAALKMNGQALSHKQKVLDCGLEVHEHTAACYESGVIPAEGTASQGEEKPVCGYADYVVHTHNDDCYGADGELVCRLPEVENHVHGDECYQEQEVLVCEKEETPGHQHTEECRKLICGKEESQGHQHTEACRTLICGKEETQGHQHTDACRTLSQGELICQNTEEGHEHTAECYEQVETITCGQEETEAHVHDESCYDFSACSYAGTEEEHIHTEECYDPYACGLEEGAEGHTHTEECYEKKRVLICGKLELHTHVTPEEAADGQESCYDAEGNLICGIPELKEHVHGEDCFVTTELTKEEVEAMQGSEDAEQDAEKVEESSIEQTLYQKTYEDESVKIVAAYYGSANIPVEAELYAEMTEQKAAAETELPADADVDNAENAPDSGAVNGTEENGDAGDAGAEGTSESGEDDGTAEGVEPVSEEVEPGSETETGGTADAAETNGDPQVKGRTELVAGEATYKVGFRLDGAEIVPENTVTFTVWNLEEEGSEPETIAYSAEDGFENMTVTVGRMVEVFVQTEFQKEYEDDNIRVIAEYGKSAEIPKEAVLKVYEITPESDSKRFAECEAKFREAVEDETAEMSTLLDIGFYLNDLQIEPKDTVTMMVQFLDGQGQPIGEPVNVVHFAEEKTEVLEESSTDEEGYVIFETESFSPFAFFQAVGATMGVGLKSAGANEIPLYVLQDGEWIKLEYTNPYSENFKFTGVKKGDRYIQYGENECKVNLYGSSLDYGLTQQAISNYDYTYNPEYWAEYPERAMDYRRIGISYRGEDNKEYIATAIVKLCVWQYEGEQVGSMNRPIWVSEYPIPENSVTGIYYFNSSEKESFNKPLNEYLAGLDTTQYSMVVFNSRNDNGQAKTLKYDKDGGEALYRTVLRIAVEEAADNKTNTVNITLPSDSDLGNPFVLYSDETVKGQIKNDQIFEDISNGEITVSDHNGAYKNGYKLVGWYDVLNEEYFDVSSGSCPATIDLTKNHVFYADWVANSYDFYDAETDSNSIIATENTNDFVTTRVYDYNELFNTYSAGIDNLPWNGIETWTDTGTCKLTGGSSFLFWEAEYPTGKLNATNNLKSWNGSEERLHPNKWGESILEYLFPTDDSSYRGVHYLGKGNYLFKHVVEGTDKIGHYVYDSNSNGASYQKSEERFYVYNHGQQGPVGRNGFFPLNDSSDYSNAGSTNNTINYHFGMSCEINFYLPADTASGGNKIDGKNMRFTFSGDDDVWVYVEPAEGGNRQLLLDLGGIHPRKAGIIDFSEGIVYTDCATNDNGDVSSSSAGTGSFSLPKGSYKMTVYYLERGAGGSNCMIDFNIVPQYKIETAIADTMEVTKEWVVPEDIKKTASIPKYIELSLYKKANTAKWNEDTATEEKKKELQGKLNLSDEEFSTYFSNMNAELQRCGDFTFVETVKVKTNQFEPIRYTWEGLSPYFEYKVTEGTISSYLSKVTTNPSGVSHNVWMEDNTLNHDSIIILNHDATKALAYKDGGLAEVDVEVENGVIIVPSIKDGNGVVQGQKMPDEIIWNVEKKGEGCFLQNSAAPVYLSIGVTGENVSLVTANEGHIFTLDVAQGNGLSDNTHRIIYQGGFTVTNNNANDNNNTTTDNLRVRVYANKPIFSEVHRNTVVNTYVPNIVISKIDSETETKIVKEKGKNGFFTLTRTIKDSATEIPTFEYYDGKEWKSTTEQQLAFIQNPEDKNLESVFELENGTLEFKELPDGDYVLTEITPPVGYELPKENNPLRIEFKMENAKIVVSSENMPQTRNGKSFAEVSGDLTLLVRNELPPVYSEKVKFVKYSAKVHDNDGTDDDELKHLGGAGFRVYRQLTDVEKSLEGDSKPESVQLPGIKEELTEITEEIAVSDANTGIFFEGELPAGIYYLKEEQQPAGYNILTDIVKIEIRSDGTTKSVTTNLPVAKVKVVSKETGENQFWEIQIFNTQGYELPETGSLGTKPFTIGGAMLITATAILMYGYSVRRKKSERRLKK